MLLKFAVPWTDPETHVSYRPNDTVEVTDVPTAKNLIRDGHARPAPPDAEPTDAAARDVVDGNQDSDTDGSPKPPPRGGAGSGQEEWAAYAHALGVDIREDAGRDDIIDALREAGHPVD